MATYWITTVVPPSCFPSETPLTSSMVSSQRLSAGLHTKTALAAGQRTVADVIGEPPEGALAVNLKPTSLAFVAPGARWSSSCPLPRKSYGAWRDGSRQ